MCGLVVLRAEEQHCHHSIMATTKGAYSIGHNHAAMPGPTAPLLRRRGSCLPAPVSTSGPPACSWPGVSSACWMV